MSLILFTPDNGCFLENPEKPADTSKLLLFDDKLLVHQKPLGSDKISRNTACLCGSDKKNTNSVVEIKKLYRRDLKLPGLSWQ